MYLSDMNSNTNCFYQKLGLNKYLHSTILQLVPKPGKMQYASLEPEMIIRLLISHASVIKYTSPIFI